MARRDEEKKRRQIKRRLKRAKSRQSAESPEVIEQVAKCLGLLDSLKQHLESSKLLVFPGAVDPTLARPDRVKFDFANWATDSEPGKSKLKALETGICNGLLGKLPDMDHWAVEEFLWHGVPGDDWRPIDAYLVAAGDRYSPAARAQLRLWSEAKCSIYEIGAVSDDLVSLREWDPFRRCACSPWMRAISLCIGGVEFLRPHRGKFTLTYVAPWARTPDIFCEMGYGRIVPEDQIDPLLALLGLRHPEFICKPMPWRLSKAAEQEHWRAWQSREWYGWLEERMRFPFHALAREPRAMQKMKLRIVNGLLPSTAQQARDLGIYFDVPLDRGELGAIGATLVTPLDVASPNAAALREYSAYRERAGIPPGMRGRPTFFTVNPND